MAALVHSIARRSVSYNCLKTEISLTKINTHILSAGWTKISFFFVPDPNYSTFWKKRTVVDFLRGSFIRSMKLGRAQRGGTSPPAAHIPTVGFTCLYCHHLLLALLCPAPCTVWPSASFLLHLLPSSHTCLVAESISWENLTCQNQQRIAHAFAAFPVSLGKSSLLMVGGGAKMKLLENRAESGQRRRFVKGKQDLTPW